MDATPYMPVPAPPRKPRRELTRPDALFAWFSFAAGYLFCRTVPVTEAPLGGFLLVIFLFVCTAILLKVRGLSLPRPAWIAAVSAVVVSAALILSSNAFLHSWAFAYAIAAYFYFLYAAAGHACGRLFSNRVILDWFKALFVQPFCTFGGRDFFRGLVRGRSGKGGAFLLKLLLGIALAAIPTVTVLFLLSYDREFTQLVNRVFDWGDLDLLSHLGSALLAIPLGILLFGIWLSAAEGKGGEILSPEKCRNAAEKMKFAPILTAVAAVAPLLGVYLLFFVSQWDYYVSAFTGVLPEELSYAEYAREGFFQLCLVSVINLAILAAVIVFLRRGKVASAVLKALTVLFSLFTLVLISTAISKMILYIDRYGLTQKRVYATWFMLVLAVIFTVVVLGRFFPRIRALALSAMLLTAAFAGLALSNADRAIAAYNVERYRNGTLETVDISAMQELGDAAVPEMAKLARFLDEKNGTDITAFRYEDVPYPPELYDELAMALMDSRDDLARTRGDLTAVTVNRLQAEAALRELGLLEP